MAIEQVRDNTDYPEHTVVSAYWFPSESEIRIVYVDYTARPSPDPQRIVPFYFGADDEGDIPLPSALAIIRPEEKDTLQPPEGWGTWDNAQEIFASGIGLKTYA